MREIIIPERFRSGLEQIGLMADEAFAGLLTTIQAEGTAFSLAELVSRLRPTLRSVDDKDIRRIISAVTSMQGVQRTSHVEPTKFAHDVWEGLQGDAPETASLLQGDTFRLRIAALVEPERTIHIAGEKIAELKSEVERAFVGARILTDIRSAFSADLTERPAMTVIHNLELRYRDDTGQYREFYLSLDDSDLVTLKEVVVRAETKKETLSRLLTAASFEVIE